MLFSLSIENDGLRSLVKLEGPIDEGVATGLLPLLKIPNGACLIDVSKISSINSLGVRAWINIMRPFRDTHEVSFKSCPPDIVAQMNAVPSFAGSATIESVQAHFYCPGCRTNCLREFDTTRPNDEVVSNYNTQTCETCKAPLEGEETAEEFLHFLIRK